MKEYLVSFAHRYGYSKEATNALTEGLSSLCKSAEFTAFFEEIKREYDSDSRYPFRDRFDELTAIAERVGTSPYTAHFVFLVLLTKSAWAHYAAAGISREQYEENFSDLGYKLEECKLVKGVWGTFVPRWFYRFYIPDRFQFGRLQFEENTLGQAVTVSGKKFTPETLVLSVHVPRTGGRLSYEEVTASYERAVAWYYSRHKENPVFACWSYLMSETDADLFKEGSNLHRFRADYTIVQSGENADYSELWRVFDREITDDLTLLPADSSLRRAYLEKMKKGEKTGWGLGLNVKYI